MYLDLDPARIVLTRVLGRVWQGAYFARTSPLHLVEMPDPLLPSADYVRVRNRLCGVCGSDLHQLLVDAGLDVAPVALPSNKRIYLGHEMVGEVIEVGAGVTDLRVGDRVVRWGRADDCLARGSAELCAACRRGHRVLCQHASEPRAHSPVGGGFGDSFITPATSLVRVLPDLTDEQAIFTEPCAVAIHAAWRRPVQPGEHILVIGMGTIGFLMVQAIRALQPDCRITAVAQFDWQADLARDLGADDVFMVGEDGYRAVSDRTGARLYQGRAGNRMLLGGYDATFDVVGIEATLNDAMRWTRAGGDVVIVGVNLHRMRLDVTPVWYQEVNLLGAIGHDIVEWAGEPVSTFDLAQQWMRDGSFQVAPLLTHTFPLDAYRDAFAVAVDKAASRSIKVAFTL